MTELTTPRHLTPHALRSLVVIGALALSLAGCAGGPAASSSDSGSGDSAADSSNSDSSASSDSSGDGEVQVIGEDLPSFTALLLAKTYAEGRDPQPTVEFLDPTSVRFTFPTEFPEAQAIGNCQIAWGALQGEGIHVYITSGAVEQDCTAYMEG